MIFRIDGRLNRSPADGNGAGVSDKDERGQVYFEFTPMGQQVRVAAIDPQTGTEVIIIAPASASRHDMQRIATAKLMRKLERDKPA